LMHTLGPIFVVVIVGVVIVACLWGICAIVLDRPDP
jgi:hypothetical protein